MKTLSTLKSVINQSSLSAVIALVVIAPLIYPEMVAAAGLPTSGNQGLVFQINTTLQNQNSLSIQQVAQQDPLVIDLQAYLDARNSPLKDYVPQLIQHGNWPMIIAISQVESNMCIHHYYYNCSGIGGQQYLRKYGNFGEWINDMSNLLAARYNGWSLGKMDGIYVQPYSRNWLYGSTKTLAELVDLQNKALAERAALAQSITAAPTADLALLAQ